LESADWFWERINKEGPTHPHDPRLGRCWEYTGKQVKLGYGYFILRGKEIRAHRFVIFLRDGEWPSDCVLHSGDNRLCCNPNHLWIGSKAENNIDRHRKGRNGRSRGEHNGTAKLTIEDVREIRRLRGQLTHREIAKRFGVHHDHIKHIYSGKLWGWLD